MAFNEEDFIEAAIRGSRGARDPQQGSVQAIDQLLDQLTPQQLLERYKGLDEAGVTNLAQYAQQKYGVATAKDDAYYMAYKASKDLLGRPLETNEFAKLAPIFYQPGDPSAGIAQGRAALANLAEQEKFSPKNLRRRAGEFKEPVENIFQDLLKRGASQEEIEYFGSQLATGDITPYELQTFVKQLPEFREAEDVRFRGGLAKELEGYDVDFFGKAKEDVLSRFSQNLGGAARSSALDFALTDLMGDIAKERGRYLTGLSAQQYGGRQEAARADYLGNLERFLGEKDYRRAKTDLTYQDLLGRSREVEDYYRQKSDYENMLNRLSGGRRRSTGADIGQLLGMGAGAYIGRSPEAAMAGGEFGRGAGGLFDTY